MPAQRIIKKYPNRRLYDPGQRRYITVSDIRRLVQQRVNFKVVEHESRTNVTNVVLLQVIIELELAGKRVFTRSQLERALRSRRK